MDRDRNVSRLTAVEEVRCLECGELYAKPQAGGTVEENPGCPGCGYLGWISAAIPIRPPDDEHLHSDGDQPLRYAVRSH
jgi:hypothetical protein